MSDTSHELSDLVQGLAAEIERRKSRGERRTPAAKRSPRPIPATAAPAKAAPAPPAPARSGASPGSDQPAPTGTQSPQDRGAPRPPEQDNGPREEVRRVAQGCSDLASLAQAVAACSACALSQSRQRVAFAAPEAASQGRRDVLFLADAPGAEEEASGQPLAGEAGELLESIITKGMGMDPSEVHVSQLVKCRPPGDRPPSGLEKDTCSPFLERELELVDPKLILALGARAAEQVLKVDRIAPGARGKLHRALGRTLIPTFHPAFLLQHPAKKRDCWQDIQVALAELKQA